MTGMKDNNLDMATVATEHLRQLGIEVVSPWELGRDDGEVLEGDGWTASDQEYEGFIARDLAILESCDAIVFLPGWERSGGAGREGRRAIELRLALYLLLEDPFQRPGRMWYPLLRLSPEFFKRYSTTERLRPHASQAK